jgi:hypothetical protein
MAANMENLACKRMAKMVEESEERGQQLGDFKDLK